MINQEVKDLIEQKHKYLQEIYQITLQQKEVLEAEDIEGLAKLIASKQILINKVNRINSKLDQAGVSFVGNDVETQDLAEKAYTIDKENVQCAQKIYMNIKQKIGKIKQGKNVHKAYNPVINQAAFFNKAR